VVVGRLRKSSNTASPFSSTAIASPSMTKLRALGVAIAATAAGKRVVKSLPRRLKSRTISPALRAMMRKPTQPGPAGGLSVARAAKPGPLDLDLATVKTDLALVFPQRCARRSWPRAWVDHRSLAHRDPSSRQGLDAGSQTKQLEARRNVSQGLELQSSRRNGSGSRRAFSKFESYGMLETAKSRGWKAKDAIEWFRGIGRLVPES
jgi:hypothetical protein